MEAASAESGVRFKLLDPYEHVILARSERKEFPYLGELMDGWLHQDYDLMGGPTFKGIMDSYQKSTSETWQKRTAADAHRFLARFGESNTALVEAMDRVFYPCFIVEGWEGLTTRAWLLEVARILSGQPGVEKA